MSRKQNEEPKEGSHLLVSILGCSPGGGGVLWEFLGGDVPLEP